MDDRQYIYQAEGGLQSAADALGEVSRYPGFPDQFKVRVADLTRRTQRVLVLVRSYADMVRGRRAHIDALAEPIKLMRLAEQGLVNAVDGLQEAVARGGRQYSKTLRTVQDLQDAVGVLIGDMSDYSDLDDTWSTLRGGVSDAARKVDDWLFGRRASLSQVARGKARKDVGHGGLDEWFSGHGGGKGDATWGDWVAISPVKRTLQDGEQVQPGDIVGPCGVSNNTDWKDFTRGGKDPLKCMPRQKAHDTPKSERADLAREKLKAERADADSRRKPTNTPTFEKKQAGSNVPTNPDLWSKVQALTKGEIKSLTVKGKTIEGPNDGAGFDIFPSAYANGWASKVYKDLGGGWKKQAGWWTSETTGTLLGDTPADYMQDAVARIRQSYWEATQRDATLKELWETLLFVTGPDRADGILKDQ